MINVKLPNSIKTIGEQAFEGAINLEEINLHNNITRIDYRAFSGENLNAMKLNINELPTNLEYLGPMAFYNGGPNIIITKVPAKLTTIYSQTFAFCYNVKINNFGSRDGSTSQLTTIGGDAFLNAGTGNKGANVTAIYIQKTISTIEPSAFTGYATNTLTAVYFAKGESDYGGITSTSMGFPSASSETGFSISYSTQDSVFPVG